MARKGTSNMDNIVGLLGKGTEFEGKLIFDGTLRIDGKFNGEIITKGILAIGDGALVHAEIEADVIIVHGEVHGNLKAMKKIEIKGNGKLFGNIDTPSLIVDEGVVFEGTCKMSEKDQTIVPFDLGDVTPILFECNDEQKQKYFQPVLNKQKSGLLAIMEPGKEADLTNVEMTAKKSNGSYVLNGKKLSFTRPRDDYFAIVFAVTDPDKELKEKVTCFLVDKDTPGFTVVG